MFLFHRESEAQPCYLLPARRQCVILERVFQVNPAPGWMSIELFGSRIVHASVKERDMQMFGGGHSALFFAEVFALKYLAAASVLQRT